MEIKSSVTLIPSFNLNPTKHSRGRTIKNLTPISHTRDTLDFIRKASTNSKILFKSKSKKRVKNVISLTRKILVKPLLSAESWVMFHIDKTSKLEGKNEDTPREIASLTKIMTCLAVIYEFKQKRRSFDEVVQVSELAAGMEGTSAGLVKGDEIKIWDLMHGLMLPSGNDAAMALAEYTGRIIDREEDPIKTFVKKMNKIAEELELKQTVFSNPHGMSTTLNISSASDVAKLACQAMKNQIFYSICTRKKFETFVYNDKVKRKVEWENTNLLLDKGFCGVKTGTTPAAGACLCFAMRKKKVKVLGVLLACKSPEVRWVEAVRLSNYLASMKSKSFKK